MGTWTWNTPPVAFRDVTNRLSSPLRASFILG